MVTAMGIIGALFGCAATIPDCLADRNLAGIQIGEDTARDVKKEFGDTDCQVAAGSGDRVSYFYKHMIDRRRNFSVSMSVIEFMRLPWQESRLSGTRFTSGSIDGSRRRLHAGRKHSDESRDRKGDRRGLLGSATHDSRAAPRRSPLIGIQLPHGLLSRAPGRPGFSFSLGRPRDASPHALLFVSSHPLHS
jgi:hypothetical protein